MSIEAPTHGERQFIEMLQTCLRNGDVTLRFVLDYATRETFEQPPAPVSKKYIDDALPMLSEDIHEHQRKIAVRPAAVAEPVTKTRKKKS